MNLCQDKRTGKNRLLQKEKSYADLEEEMGRKKKDRRTN